MRNPVTSVEPAAGEQRLHAGAELAALFELNPAAQPPSSVAERLRAASTHVILVSGDLFGQAREIEQRVQRRVAAAGDQHAAAGVAAALGRRAHRECRRRSSTRARARRARACPMRRAPPACASCRTRRSPRPRECPRSPSGPSHADHEWCRTDARLSFMRSRCCRATDDHAAVQADARREVGRRRQRLEIALDEIAHRSDTRRRPASSSRHVRAAPPTPGSIAESPRREHPHMRPLPDPVADTRPGLEHDRIQVPRKRRARRRQDRPGPAPMMTTGSDCSDIAQLLTTSRAAALVLDCAREVFRQSGARR